MLRNPLTMLLDTNFYSQHEHLCLCVFMWTCEWTLIYFSCMYVYTVFEWTFPVHRDKCRFFARTQFICSNILHLVVSVWPEWHLLTFHIKPVLNHFKLCYRLSCVVFFEWITSSTLLIVHFQHMTKKCDTITCVFRRILTKQRISNRAITGQSISHSLQLTLTG